MALRPSAKEPVIDMSETATRRIAEARVKASTTSHPGIFMCPDLPTKGRVVDTFDCL